VTKRNMSERGEDSRGMEYLASVPRRWVTL
jgi:hypothetical protein